MSETPPALPRLYEAQLDAEGLRALERDLSALADIRSCRIKQGARAMSGEVSLTEALALLRGGEILGLQIEYLHDGRAWRDTLVRRGATTKLVRMACAPPSDEVQRDSTFDGRGGFAPAAAGDSPTRA